MANVLFVAVAQFVFLGAFVTAVWAIIDTIYEAS